MELAPQGSDHSGEELTRLWERYEPRLKAMVRWRIDPALKVRIDPEAVIAEAYLDSRRRWPAYQANRRLEPYLWLYGIVRGRLIAEWRKATRARRDLRLEAPLPSDAPAIITAGLLGSSTSPSSAAAKAELAARLREVLKLLAPDDREVLYMHYFDNLKLGEIAAVLEINYEAARKRCRRALDRLDALWHEHFPSSASSV